MADDLRAGFGKGNGNSGAETGRRTRNQRNTSVQFELVENHLLL